MSAIPDRRQLLERLGGAYGREAFAVIWTDGIKGDAARRVTRAGWPQTRPLPSTDRGAFAAALFAQRGQTRNPAITARASRLLIVETDTPEGLAQLDALELPATWTVRSSAPYRQHRYYRWPGGIAPTHVSFRFEHSISGDREHYYLAPPALHPSGAVYMFLPGRGPDDLPIAELPTLSYQELIRLAGVDDHITITSPATGRSAPASRSQSRRLRAILEARTESELDLAAADPTGQAAAYGRTVLATACARIAAAETGTRHATINKSAYIVGGLLAATGLDRAEVLAALEAAAERLVEADANFGTPANRSQTERAITRGLSAGEARPRPIPEPIT
jgi:hypothetical protein